MIDLKTLRQRATSYQNLTPAERALLKSWQTLLIAAGASAGLALLEYVRTGGKMDWQSVAIAFGTGFVIALAHGALKLLSAADDPQLSKDAATLDKVVTQVAADLSRGNPNIVSDLEQVGLSALPVFEEVTGTSVTARLPAVSAPQPAQTGDANATPGQ